MIDMQRPDATEHEEETVRGMVRFRVAYYDRFDDRHHRLFEKTWARFVASGEAKSVTREQLCALYDRNHAGSSILAVAEHEGTWVGAVSAIATPILSADGNRTVAMQIGDFMVDPDWQGHGLGGKLLRQLTAYLAVASHPVFTFPNIRSIGIFLKQDYVEVRTVPAVGFPLHLVSLLFGGHGSGLRRTREVGIEEAAAIAEKLITLPRSKGTIEKGSAYLLWRYGLIREAADYTFTVVEDDASGAVAVVVWNLFRFRRVPVQVIVDMVAREETRPFYGAIARLGSSRGAWVGVTHVDRDVRPGRPPLSIAVPTRFDPRPARLLVPPDDPRSGTIFEACRFTTGDWLGF